MTVFIHKSDVDVRYPSGKPYMALQSHPYTSEQTRRLFERRVALCGCVTSRRHRPEHHPHAKMFTFTKLKFGYFDTVLVPLKRSTRNRAESSFVN
ncbi:hypothetical protein TNCV_1952191 [Trichonephila clavipes]|nr:hypothetical protein TNCV_1952191 [Trichonephila clavipes]